MNRAILPACLLALVLISAGQAADNDGSGPLAARIAAIIDQPRYAGSQWGLEFQLLGSKAPYFELNPQQGFVAASAEKLFTEATAFETLGPDYRFHTRVYRTGEIVDGIVQGDVVLVASGDLFISSRVQPNGSIALGVPDHSYGTVPGAGPIPGDPLLVMRQMARLIAASGIRGMTGNVVVDASLFPQGLENLGLGPGEFPVSPMMVNDNLIDITVTPGANAGDPAVLTVSPNTDYLRFVDQVTTVAADATPTPLAFGTPITSSDGTHTITLGGEVLLGGPSTFRSYYVPEPIRFGEDTLAIALRNAGVAAPTDFVSPVNIGALSTSYTEPNLVAEHTSPPLSQEIEVMMKVSSNIHAVMYPYLIGAIAEHAPLNAKASGEQAETQVLAQAGLAVDPSGTFSPDFFVRFLSYVAGQDYFPAYFRALPILGKDGDLATIAVGTPAAGHVYAKTGSGLSAINPTIYKALAGYIQLRGGRWVVFSEFMDMPAPAGSTTTSEMALINSVGDSMGEIAAAAYEVSDHRQRRGLQSW